MVNLEINYQSIALHAASSEELMKLVIVDYLCFYWRARSKMLILYMDFFLEKIFFACLYGSKEFWKHLCLLGTSLIQFW